MNHQLLNTIEDAVRAIESLKEKEALAFIQSTCDAIVRCYENGGKLLIAGNGGSLCDAMHFAEELTGFYREKRPPLAAIALGDPGHMSCVANDQGFEFVFSRLVDSLGKENDLFIALTTSGNSKNLIQAATTARSKSIKTVGFLGKSGGDLKELCDLHWIVKGFKYSDRIQEAHMTAIHIIIEMVEERIFRFACC